MVSAKKKLGFIQEGYSPQVLQKSDKLFCAASKPLDFTPESGFTHVGEDPPRLVLQKGLDIERIIERNHGSDNGKFDSTILPPHSSVNGSDTDIEAESGGTNGRYRIIGERWIGAFRGSQPTSSTEECHRDSSRRGHRKPATFPS